MPTPSVNDLYTLFFGKPVESMTPPEVPGGFGIVHFEDGSEQFSSFVLPSRSNM